MRAVVSFILLPFLIALLPFDGQSQPLVSNKWSIGVEQDVLPYATGGYFAGLWAGKKQVRVRALTAHVHKPDLLVKDGFTNNKITAYALLGDYFLKEGWKGWWIASGLVYWKSSIQAKERIGTAAFQNMLVNGSLGYNWKFYKNFYLSPWAGLHLRVGGDRSVLIDGQTYKPALLNPEASVKLGWFFQ